MCLKMYLKICLIRLQLKKQTYLAKINLKKGYKQY